MKKIVMLLLVALFVTNSFADKKETKVVFKGEEAEKYIDKSMQVMGSSQSKINVGELMGMLKNRNLELVKTTLEISSPKWNIYQKVVSAKIKMKGIVQLYNKKVGKNVDYNGHSAIKIATNSYFKGISDKIRN